MEEVLARRLPGDEVRTDAEDRQSEQRFDVRGNHEDGGDAHRQSKERKLKDKFPVHGGAFCPTNIPHAGLASN